MAFVRESHSKRPPDLLLQMDHWVEELSPAQQSYYDRAERECSEILSKIDELLKKEGSEVIEKGQNVMVVQTSPRSSTVPSLSSMLASSNPAPGATSLAAQLPPIQVPSIQAVPSQQLLIQSSPVQTPVRNARQTPSQVPTFPSTSNTFQLVMDPRLGLIVNAVPTPQPPVSTVASSTTVLPPPPIQSPAVPTPILPRLQTLSTVSRTAVTKATTTTNCNNQIRTTTSSCSTSAASTTTATVLRSKPKTTTTVSQSIPAPISTPTIPTSGNRPTENSSIGGLSAGSSNRKLAIDERAAGPDSREVTFSKMSGKTFPSLVVLARPFLRSKEISQSRVNQERSALDAKVKSVLMYSATKFTEWLIQQGLVRSEQYCSVHSTASSPVKLKLGMYSDVTKFPYSGGYVWISDCCPSRFVSVFSGSIFEGAPHPPSVLLKLMYHWCCQTNVQNVVQWVKVDNFYVKNFFTSMRSVCVSAVQELHEKLGGPQKKVEVGVISLGTTSQDGNMRQVKVEVLGVMDPESKLVRLRAVEPLQDGERNYKRRFVKILEPLDHWVHKDSIIVTDFTVDKGTLQSMGFSQVMQSTIPDSAITSNISNHNIMEYLRRIVPRMFQNTLSLLSRQIIQQFLDELVWRERWGPVPSQSFDSLVLHLSAQTKLDSGESLLLKLGKIAANPFRNWDYASWKTSNTCIPTAPPSQAVVNSTKSSTSRVVNSFSTSNRSGSTIQKPSSKDIVASEPLVPPPPLASIRAATDPDRPKITIALRRKYELKAGEDVAKKLELALAKLESGMSVRKAIELFKIARSLLMEKAVDVLKNKKYDSPVIFSPDEEQDIVDHLFTLHDWGYPFGRWDIRLIVKQYLDCCGRVEPKFKENFPGDMWIEKFLVRHPVLKEKLCRNIPARGTFIDTDAVQQYILNLSSVIQGVSPVNIVNFMEIGLTGDPLRSMTVELRDLRYPVGKRKVKSAASMMLACSASGQILPVYVIFEGKHFTVNQGPAPGEYYGAKCGWFDECAFEQWLESVLFPWADSLPGKKIIIGDSLAQLFSVKTLALCVDKNITFVCMPCNVTSILSPLDITLFDAFKVNWRSIARSWSSTHGDKHISIDAFPSQIHDLLSLTIGSETPRKLQDTFKSIGLYPFNSKATIQVLHNGGINVHIAREALTKQGDVQNDVRKNRKRVFSIPTEISSKKALSNEQVSGVEKCNTQISRDQEQGQKDVVALKEALESSKELVSLEEYYYGTKEPDHDVVSKEYQIDDLRAKCPLCQTFVSSNIILMKHILGHSEDNPSVSELSSLIQCKYCVQKFRSSDDLEIHLREAHKNFTSQLICLICVKKFACRQTLILHMHKYHTRLELPFHCSICFYRSSEQYKLVDHFYEVHAGGEKVQCPFCLKCVAISNNGKKMPANTFFFMQHVRKHQSRSSSRRCEKCALWFVHKGILKEHQSKEHLSFGNDQSVVPYSCNKIDGIMMPLPGTSFPPSGGKGGSNFTCKSFKNLNVNVLRDSHLCAECHAPFTPDHVQSYMACLQCSFCTCCSTAMAKHMQIFHYKNRLRLVSSPSLMIPEEMFCECGFNSRHGNVLASHLVVCGRPTVYASPTSTTIKSTSGTHSASFPPLVTLDDGVDGLDNWLSAFSKKKTSDSASKDTSEKKGKEPLSMLNVLGLVRKNSIEESSDKCYSVYCADDGNSKERPASRGSTGSGSSRVRKRVAENAGLGALGDGIEVIPKGSNVASNCHTDVPRKRISLEHSKELLQSRGIDPDINSKVSNLSEITVTPVRKDQ